MSNQKETEEIDLLELGKGVWSKRKYILKFTAISFVVGIIIAFSIPKEYTTKVLMAQESSKAFNNKLGGMMDLMALAGTGDVFSQGSGNDALTAVIYPDIVSSTPFIEEFSKIMVQPKGWDKAVSLYDYMKKGQKTPWWSTIIGFPGYLISLFTASEKDDDNIGVNAGGNGATKPAKIYLKEDRVFKAIENKLKLKIDPKNNTLEASVTDQDAKVSAVLADSLVNQLERYVTEYRTKKAKTDYEFNVKLYEEAKQAYYKAQANYAYFEDNNRNIVRQSANLERARLMNEQNMTYSIYTGVAQQMEMSKIKVQEMTPVVTIIEPAVIPKSPSNTGKASIIIIFILIGTIVGAFTVIVKELIFKKESDL